MLLSVWNNGIVVMLLGYGVDSQGSIPLASHVKKVQNLENKRVKKVQNLENKSATQATHTHTHTHTHTQEIHQDHSKSGALESVRLLAHKLLQGVGGSHIHAAAIHARLDNVSRRWDHLQKLSMERYVLYTYVYVCHID